MAPFFPIRGYSDLWNSLIGEKKFQSLSGLLEANLMVKLRGRIRCYDEHIGISFRQNSKVNKSNSVTFHALAQNTC